MSKATRTRAGAQPRPPASAGSEDDFGRALGVLLRSYRELVSQALGDFPHGPRGYQTLFEVVRGQQPQPAALATRLGIDRTVMTPSTIVAADLVRRDSRSTGVNAASSPRRRDSRHWPRCGSPRLRTRPSPRWTLKSASCSGDFGQGRLRHRGGTSPPTLRDHRRRPG